MKWARNCKRFPEYHILNSCLVPGQAVTQPDAKLLLDSPCEIVLLKIDTPSFPNPFSQFIDGFYKTHSRFNEVKFQVESSV